MSAAPSALAEARRELARRRLPFRLDSDRAARLEWSDVGLSLAQRDKAVDQLVDAGRARLVPGRIGITVEPAEGER